MESRQRYLGLESDLQLNRLRNECSADRAKIASLQSMVYEIESDPNKNRPSNIDQKRKLPKLKLQLQRLQSKYEDQRQLLENIEEMGNMNAAMQRAAAVGDETMVRRLLSRGVDVNIADAEAGYTAFQYCCSQGHCSVAKIMITDGGANVNDRESNTTFPLLLATTKCHVDVVQLLIESGAIVDQRDSLEQTPLIVACEKDCSDIVKILLDAGANPNAQDRLHANTGLHYSAMNGNDQIANLLVKHGASDSLKNKANQTALHISRSGRQFKVVDHCQEVRSP